MAVQVEAKQMGSRHDRGGRLREVGGGIFDAAAIAGRIVRSTAVYSSLALGLLAFFWTDSLIGASTDTKVYLASRVVFVVALVACVAHGLMARHR